MRIPRRLVLPKELQLFLVSGGASETIEHTLERYVFKLPNIDKAANLINTLIQNNNMVLKNSSKSNDTEILLLHMAYLSQTNNVSVILFNDGRACICFLTLFYIDTDRDMS